MKNKIVANYEKKIWYRVIKVLFILIFVLSFFVVNSLILSDGSFNFLYLIIGNILVVFVMGAIEGLFWYLTNGVWGYPKELEYSDLEKKINKLELLHKDLVSFDESSK